MKKEKYDGLDDLAQRKRKIRADIEQQEVRLNNAYLEVFSFQSLAGFVLKKMTRSMTVIDGFLLGFKVLKILKRIFTKK